MLSKRVKILIIVLIIISISLVLFKLLIHSCDSLSGGDTFGNPQRYCDCLGSELTLVDNLAADGHRYSICIGIVKAEQCHKWININDKMIEIEC